MFDVQIGMFPSFSKTRQMYDLWCMSQLIMISYGTLFLMSEYVISHARLSNWLFVYWYLFDLTCSSFFKWWELLKQNKQSNWFKRSLSMSLPHFKEHWEHCITQIPILQLSTSNLHITKQAIKLLTQLLICWGHQRLNISPKHTDQN